MTHTLGDFEEVTPKSVLWFGEVRGSVRVGSTGERKKEEDTEPTKGTETVTRDHKVGSTR